MPPRFGQRGLPTPGAGSIPSNGLSAGEASALFDGGRVTGCSRDRTQFWPVAEILYSARLFVPGRGYVDVAGKAPLRNLLAVDPTTGLAVDHIRPAPVGAACRGVWHNGAIELIVYGEEVAAFVCPPTP